MSLARENLTNSFTNQRGGQCVPIFRVLHQILHGDVPDLVNRHVIGNAKALNFLGSERGRAVFDQRHKHGTSSPNLNAIYDTGNKPGAKFSRPLLAGFQKDVSGDCLGICSAGHYQKQQRDFLQDNSPNSACYPTIAQCEVA